MSKPAKRFRFIEDDSSHWYAIPAEKQVQFESWCLSFEDEAENYSGEDFERYRLNMHPTNCTFTDLREDD